MTELGMRPDAHRLLASRGDRRSPERLRAHFDLELRLADRLRNAGAVDRTRIYGEVYKELFVTLDDHPQKTINPSHRLNNVTNQINNIRDRLSPKSSFLEIGCGDALMSFQISPIVENVFSLDVTDSLISWKEAPANFHFLLTDGIKIPLGDAQIDLAFSDQLIEHLHPDDAYLQLREIFRVMKSGGYYWISTPSRLTGPHDISCFFHYEAKGFHLREYDYTSLYRLLKSAGFRDVIFLIGKSGKLMRLPTGIGLTVEAMMSLLPSKLRSRLTDNAIAANFFGIRALAVK